METITVDIAKAEELTTALHNLTLEIGKIEMDSNFTEPEFSQEIPQSSIPPRSINRERKADRIPLPRLPLFRKAPSVEAENRPPNNPLPEILGPDTIDKHPAKQQQLPQQNHEEEGHENSKTITQPEVDLIQFNQSMAELMALVEQAKAQINQGSIEKDLLFKLNVKLANAKANYGHIAAIAVALAAVISGIKDLIELLELMN